ncbi:MAG: PTS IIA-like nitrogen regulatory protein PtsN [Gammaproteobacteria bacterium]|nr:PTS IIA-like nitrogen regulatory protein PtsN [Gammaproteobacteria bacterium]
MQLENILTPDRCYCDVETISKKRLLKKISEKIATDINHLQSNQIFEALMARERLGSTGLGKGIAIPHCRVSSSKEIIACLVTLDQPVDFDAVDSIPVDLLFLLIVPEQKTDEHVRVLAHLAALFNDENFCKILRNTHNGKALYDVAINYQL